MEQLFSYGTLQYPAVQQRVFGRLIQGVPDAIVGYTIVHIPIDDEALIQLTGDQHFRMLVPSSCAEQQPIVGLVFTLSAAELSSADRYEGSLYQRIKVPLLLGGSAWVYASRVKG